MHTPGKSIARIAATLLIAAAAAASLSVIIH
jgi:hypothetical protein